MKRKSRFLLLAAGVLLVAVSVAAQNAGRGRCLRLQSVAIRIDNADRHLESVLALREGLPQGDIVPGVVHELRAIRIQLQAAHHKALDVIDSYPPDAVVPDETAQAARHVEDAAAFVELRAQAGFGGCDCGAAAQEALRGVELDAGAIVELMTTWP